MALQGYGTFGNLGRDYQKARHAFPAAVFDLFAQHAHPPVHVLDLGCGTGIASRQLAERGYHVVGTDIDPAMIAFAREERGSIEYHIAPSAALPFADGTFDAATAFSAFHWFSDNASVTEIKRVLKPKGIFMAVNKNDVSGFKIGYRAVLAPFIEVALPNAKKDYAPAHILTREGFTSVEKYAFRAEEFYTLDEALAYLRSVSLWNLVPDSKKVAANEAIVHYCEGEMRDSVLTRVIDVVAVLGHC